MPELPPKLFLIDGHATLYKAFHGVAPLTNAAGEPTGATFGFLQSFHRIRKAYRPTHLAVVFDPEGPTFRAELAPEYKANRPPAPPELIAQFQSVREVLAAMAVPIFEQSPFEADDLIASLARWAVENGGEALIVSVDKDLCQCVRPGVTILREHLGKIEILDEQGVLEKMGVRPAQVPDYLGLLGDSSDNIAGVPGIGKKRAAEILAEFGTLEAAIAEAQGKAKPKFWVSLAENAEAALRSRQLARVKDDIPVGASWDALRWEYHASPELRSVLARLEFRNLLAELPAAEGDAPAEEAAPAPERVLDHRTVADRAGLEACAAGIREAGLAAIDTETTGLDPYTSDLVGIALSWRRDQGVYVPVGRGADRVALDVAREVLGPVLADPAVHWVAHNWRFDYQILDRAGFPLPAPVDDTMIEAFLVNPDRSSNGLKALSLAELGIEMTRIDALIGDGDLVTMADVAIERVSDYACQDADSTLQLHHRFAPQLDAAVQRSLYEEVERPLVPVLARMELEGVRIDPAHFAGLAKETKARLAALTGEIHELAGGPFNINSTQQLAKVLFEDLKLPTQKKTTTGFSTDVTVLEALAPLHDLPRLLLEYRQLEKLRGTYIEALPALVNRVTGRIHTSFNQTIAATGRLSSSDPNLQNIPVRTEAGRRIREGFVPRQEGWVLLGADYSQVELRILAHMSGDEALTQAFRDRADIHALTASKVFGIPQGEVTKEQRNQAKAVNFGIIYGMSAFRLANDMSIPREEAQAFIDNYFRVYAGVRAFIDATLEECRRTGFVTTLKGRRRPIPDINASNRNARSQAERIAVNTPIQGTSADMIKIAMIRIDKRLRDEGLRARMILQVHDELILDCPADEADAVGALVVEEMKAALPLSVPLEVDVATGPNWAEV